MWQIYTNIGSYSANNTQLFVSNTIIKNTIYISTLSINIATWNVDSEFSNVDIGSWLHSISTCCSLYIDINDWLQYFITTLSNKCGICTIIPSIVACIWSNKFLTRVSTWTLIFQRYVNNLLFFDLKTKTKTKNNKQ